MKIARILNIIKKARFFMRSLLILTLFMILTSCGQENISNTIEDTSNEVAQENQLDNNESDNDSDSIQFYDEVVAETQESSEVDEVSDLDDDTEETYQYIDFNGTIHRSKDGEVIYTDENGEVIDITEFSPSAQNVIDSLTFPTDSYEVTISGDRSISNLVTQSSISKQDLNIERYIPDNIPSLSVEYSFYADSISLNEVTTHPERSDMENTYTKAICGDIYFDDISGEIAEGLRTMIIFDYIENTSYMIYVDIDIDDMSDLGKLLSLQTDLEQSKTEDNKGCVYSSENPYNEYSLTWRKILNIKDYVIGW
jgi:hypothetical protein